MAFNTTTLTGLVSVSTPHLLTYSIPLLLGSFLLTLAGTFLTLDRSRSFTSSYDAVPLPGSFKDKKHRRASAWTLHGGLGGLASGYVFGLQASTFLALLIPNISSSASLSPNVFLAVWILSSIPMSFLGGRFRYCALIFPALTGGTLSALALSVIVHPSLLSRRIVTIFLAVTSPLSILLFSVPRLSRFFRPTLRLATASTGSFNLVLSIALLAHVPAWADVWERLWLSDGDSWGTSKEKGLSVAFCLFLSLGVCVDWALNHWIGENPDEKWDNYLGSYAANLPNDASRAGVFRPLPSKSIWNRLFPSSTKQDIQFPLTGDLSHQSPRDSLTKDMLLSNEDLAGSNLIATPILKKGRTHKKRKDMNRPVGRKPVIFGASYSSSDSDEGLEDGIPRPWMKQNALRASPSSPTLVDDRNQTYKVQRDFLEYGNDSDIEKGKKDMASRREAPEYSDFEEDDLGTPKKRKAPHAIAHSVEKNWTPGFIKRHSSGSPSVSQSAAASSDLTKQGGEIPLGAVPLTPSLINALDRISAAQKDAFARDKESSKPPDTFFGLSKEDGVAMGTADGKGKKKDRGRIDGMPIVAEQQRTQDEEEAEAHHKRQRASEWKEFWRDVRHRAHES